ncbi:MAG: hypothetical protein V7717_07690 [Porticoccaceae bacterium]
MLNYESINVGDLLPSRDHAASIVQLFMYNAAIWNPHRIHFDHAYATEEEGYEAIVLDGPLQGDWVGQVVTDWIGEDASLVSFGYANRRVAFLGETMSAGGVVEEKDDDKKEIKVSLYLKNAEGEITIPGHAVVKF